MDTNTISAALRQRSRNKGERHFRWGRLARLGLRAAAGTRCDAAPRASRSITCVAMPDPFEFRFLHSTAMPELFAFGSGVECRFGYVAGGRELCVDSNSHRGSLIGGAS